MSAECDLTEGGDGHKDRPRLFKSCGDCGLCCKLLLIESIGKPQGVLCRHFAKGAGCSVHGTKPAECRKFQCLWTVSDSLGAEWRPDRARFILWSDVRGRLIVEVDANRPSAWRREPYYSQLKAWADRNQPDPIEVLVRVAGRMLVLFPETEVDLGQVRPDCAVDSGYHVEYGRRIPFARYVEAAAL